MNQLEFSIEINATKDKVWRILWQDKTLRQWAGIIDPGTYMIGDLKVGSEVEFISAENGYGVTSLVERVVEGEYLSLRHQADTQESGAKEREKQWTGSTESYALVEKEGTTTLTVTFDVPQELEEYFKEIYPKALARVKEMAESNF